MASFTYSPSGPLAAPRSSSHGTVGALLRLPRLLLEVWTEARAMQAEASRRYPHAIW